MTDKATVIERIRKLLVRRENRGATPAEAAQAIELVCKLLKKHGLDIEEVQASEDREHDESVQHRTKTVRDWALSLASYIADHFGCSMYRKNHHRGCVFLFRGPEHLATVCKWLYLAVANDLYHAGTRSARKASCRGGKITAHRNQFCEAATHQIWKRLNPQEAADLEEEVKREIEAMEKDGKHATLSRRNRQLAKQYARYADAYSSGRQFGQQVSLNTNAVGQRVTANIEVQP